MPKIRPNSFEHKKQEQVSGNTVARYREPTSDMAAYMTQYVHDYMDQKAFEPAGKCIVNATQSRSIKGDKTTNRSGRSASLGAISNAFVGGVRRGSGPF